MQSQRPHEILEFDQQRAESEKNKAIEAMFEGKRPEYVELSDKEAKMLSALSEGRRNGWMRNRPCPCGSGKKFKRCHW